MKRILSIYTPLIFMVAFAISESVSLRSWTILLPFGLMTAATFVLCRTTDNSLRAADRSHQSLMRVIEDSHHAALRRVANLSLRPPTLPFSKARELLLLLLTDAQQAELLERASVQIRGSEGNYYTIQYGYTGNVQDMSNGRYLCAFPPELEGQYYATMVAQLLMITTDEKQFLEIAR